MADEKIVVIVKRSGLPPYAVGPFATEEEAHRYVAEEHRGQREGTRRSGDLLGVDVARLVPPGQDDQVAGPG